MPPKTTRKCLERILGNLSGENFARFVNELVKRQQEPRVLLHRVEGRKHWEVVDVMISTFTESPAVEVAMDLLEEIDLTGEAEELESLARTCGYKPASAPGDAGAAAAGGAAAGAAAARPPKKHFVDEHRNALIQDLKLIDPILDVLRCERVITPEMYGDIRAERTPENRMRKLFEYLDTAGDDGKDVFLSALKDQQEFLYKKLLKRSGQAS